MSWLLAGSPWLCWVGRAAVRVEKNISDQGGVYRGPPGGNKIGGRGALVSVTFLFLRPPGCQLLIGPRRPDPAVEQLKLVCV